MMALMRRPVKVEEMIMEMTMLEETLVQRTMTVAEKVVTMVEKIVTETSKQSHLSRFGIINYV